MRILLRSIFILLTRMLGMAILASAILANQIGLDNDARWGWGRLLIMLTGALVLASPSLHQSYQDMKKEHRIKIQMGLAAALILTMYVWQVNFGYWDKWPKTTNYYNSLAAAFQHGQAALLIEPDPSLLALKDPYDIQLRTEARVRFLNDLSLYKGNYYIYWGPVPSLLLLPVKFFYGAEIGDHEITFWFLLGLFILNCLFAFAIWRDHFSDLPIWLCILGIIVLGTINPIAWLLHRGLAYQVAISAGQFFLMGTLYWLYSAFRHNQPKTMDFFISSVLLACAIGSRFILILPAGFILASLFIRLYREGYSDFIQNWKSAVAVVILPLFIGVIALGWYNWIRFDSVFDFGMKYQINNFNYPKGHTFFSISYTPANIYNYFFLPFNISTKFPFLTARVAKEISAFGLSIPAAYYPEKLSGILFASPFVILAVIPIYSLIKKNVLEKDLWWLVVMLTGAIILSMGVIFLYFFGSMRFIEDFMPALALLALTGFWHGYKLFGQARMGWAYAATSIIMSIATIAIGVILALSSTSKVPIFVPPPIVLEWLMRLSSLVK